MNLFPHHIEDLRSSGLSEAIIEASGCYSVDRQQATVLLGFDPGCGALVFTYPHLDGVNGKPLFFRLKPDLPYQAPGWKKPAKYLTPKGATNHLYVPPNLDPAVLKDPSADLWLTEGEKKALKATAEGFPCVALSGVWSWTSGKDAGTGQRHAIPDLDLITWKGRGTNLTFDSDAVTNSKVRQAEYEFKDHLRARGANVRIVRLPAGSNGEKVGLDDFLVQHGPEALRRLLDSPRITTVTPPQARRVDFPLELPDSVWRGVFRDYRDALAKTTEAADSFHLFTFLACAGSVIGRRVFIPYGLSLHGNLYVCIVGPTAEGRKTTSLRHAERAIREVDPFWRVLRGLASAEGLLSQIADPWERTNSKGKVIEQGGTTDKRLMIWLGELSSLLRKAKQDRVANIIPILTEAFDCPLDQPLPTRNNPIIVTEPYISLIAASTPSWLEDLQDRDVLGGFGNRFVYVLGPPKDPIPFPDPPDARLMERVVSHIRDVLKGLPESLEVTLTREARDLWAEFYTRWKSQKWPDEMFAALVQRIPDITLKIALIYAVLEKRREIDADILTAAIDAGGYCVASAQRIFSEFHATRTSKLEGRVLEVLKEGPVKSWALHRAIGGGRYSAEEINRALDALCRSGAVTRVGQGERGANIFSLTPEDEN